MDPGNPLPSTKSQVEIGERPCLRSGVEERSRHPKLGFAGFDLL